MLLRNKICVFLIFISLVELNNGHLKILSGIANHVADTLDKVEQRVHKRIGKIFGKNCDINNADHRPHDYGHNHDTNQNFESHRFEENAPERNFQHNFGSNTQLNQGIDKSTLLQDELYNHNGYESQTGILGSNNQQYESHDRPVRRRPNEHNHYPYQNNDDIGYSSSKLNTRKPPIRKHDDTVTDSTVEYSQNGVKIDVRFGDEE